jgi:hypothetical protein
LLGALLVGIVGLNVFALSFSASSSNAGQAADELRRQNSALQTQIAGKLSNSEIQAVAAKLGLVMPAAGSFRYLDASGGDAKRAAERLRGGELTTATVAPLPAETAPVETAPVETAPVETVPVEDVAVTEPAAATDPAAADPASVAPPAASTPPVADAPTTAGAVGAP